MSRAVVRALRRCTARCRSPAPRRRAFAAHATAHTSVSEDMIRRLAEQRPANVTLEMLVHTGLLPEATARGSSSWEEPTLTSSEPGIATDEVLLQIASFLGNELPRRYAHRIRELDGLPPQLRERAGVRECRQQFVDSIAEVLRFSDDSRQRPGAHSLQSLDEERAFAKTVKQNMDRHAKTLVLMAGALFEYQRECGLELGELADDHALHSRLDSFQLGRIGTRVLCGQFLELHRGWEGRGTRFGKRTAHDDHYIGLINRRASPAAVARYAIEDATKLCEREFGCAPEVLVDGDLERVFPYIPSHLYYMLFELLKNGMRAVVMSHRGYCDTDGACSFMPYLVGLPRMELLIAHSESNEDVVIKIHDKGGGIARSHVNRLFSYLFTTARPSHIESSKELLDFGQRAPMAGLGYGLPISRAYARYFGGELTVISVEGHSTDAYLHLNKLGDSDEPLPYFWDRAGAGLAGADMAELHGSFGSCHDPGAWPSVSSVSGGRGAVDVDYL